MKSTNIFIGTIILLVIVFLTVMRVYRCESLWGLTESIIISIVTGLIAGFFANRLYERHQRTSKLDRVRKELRKFIGHYSVYHWGHLDRPDFYQVTIEENQGLLRIKQTGTTDDHILEADIKIDEMTFNYGEGNYIHPKKDKRPTGRMILQFVEPGTINVDKYYLDIKNNSEFIPGWEKWQWRMNNAR